MESILESHTQAIPNVTVSEDIAVSAQEGESKPRKEKTRSRDSSPLCTGKVPIVQA